MFKTAMIAGLGGFAGSALRYLLSATIGFTAGGFPLATLTVNFSGSLLIGFFLALFSGTGWHYLLVAGFCGGFTTFSAFSAETLTLIEGGRYLTGAAYIAISIVFCVTAVWLGITLGQKILN